MPFSPRSFVSSEARRSTVATAERGGLVEVAVPSAAVAEDAVRHLRLDRGRVVVIAEAVDRSLYRRSEREIASVRSRYELPERYLVWVGGLRHPDPDKHIAELARNKRVEGITAINDYSARGEMRVVIELRRDVMPRRIINYLLKHTARRTRATVAQVLGRVEFPPEWRLG